MEDEEKVSEKVLALLNLLSTLSDQERIEFFKELDAELERHMAELN